MSDTPEPEIGELDLLATTDAQVWAEQFHAILKQLYADSTAKTALIDSFDVGWLIGWFANAIETGRGVGYSQGFDAGFKKAAEDVKFQGNFIVITGVPGTDETLQHGGNLASVMELYETVPGTMAHKRVDPLLTAISLRAPVFVLGEILICDSDGREIGGHGRKPAKWDVRYEEFRDLSLALDKANEILRPQQVWKDEL